MLYLSAQPASIYFFWQLDILLENLRALGVLKKNVHILLAVRNQENSLIRMINEFIERNRDKASIYIYRDTRKERQYRSGVRPHIIAKHFERFPSLNTRTIFYHDSDIVFRALPKVQFGEGHCWYASDVKSYLGYEYLKSHLCDSEIEMMCKIIGINLSTVKANDCDVCGAQYILKNVPLNFWEKLEKDSESIYIYLLSIKNRIENGNYDGTPNIAFRSSIQAWCADMWAFLWNAWKLKIIIRSHRELSFCLPNDNIEKWWEYKILHYSGLDNILSTDYFRKSKYRRVMPFYDYKLAMVKENNCSYPIVKKVIEYKSKYLDNKRVYLDRVIFIIVYEFTSINDIEIIKCFIAWLDKNFSNEIVFVETGEVKYWNVHGISQTHKYFNGNCLDNDDAICQYVKDNAFKFGEWEQSIVFKYPIIQDVKTIQQFIKHIPENDFVAVYFLNLIEVDLVFSLAFAEILEEELLFSNFGKFKVSECSGDSVILLLDKSSSLKFKIEQSTFLKMYNKNYVFLLNKNLS